MAKNCKKSISAVGFAVFNEVGKLRRRRSGVKFFFILACAALVFLGIMATPLFSVRNIVFHGSTVYSDESLIRQMGISDTGFGANSIFFLSSRALARNLEELPYIREATIVKEYPDTLIVTLAERIRMAQVFDGTQGLYVTVDFYGYVLEILGHATTDIPIIEGLRFSGYSLGSVLITDGVNLMPTVIRLAGILDRYGMTNVARVNIADLNDIRLYVNNITVRIGSMQDADLKIQNTKNILTNVFNQNDRGTLFIYNTENAYFAFGD